MRKQLEGKYEKLQAVTNLRSKIHLINKLQAYQKRRYETELNEGIIDNKKIISIILGKKDNIYKKLQHITLHDTVISILLDNSGSMRGKPIILAAKAIENIMEIIMPYGIGLEILGFTTAEWKGGKSYRLWKENGSPKNPGRLNDLRFIIYKSFKATKTQAKQNLALIMKEGLLKENIDGEALLWAYKRLQKLPQTRKILLVITDGAPVDDATISNNNEDILEKHLHSAIKLIETTNKVEVFAIGIGHDVSKYYRNSIVINSAEDLGNTLFEMLARKF